MAEVIRMPRMSDTMVEGNIVGWLKEEGETIEPGETLAEVETDKATMELDSYSEGVLLHIAVKEGTVPINGVIAVVGEEGEDWKAAIVADEKKNGGGNGAAPAEKEEVDESNTTTAPQASAPQASESNTSDDIIKVKDASDEKRVKASPLAKSMASEAGINISQITGTGDNGRIVKKDVEAYLNSEAKPAPAATSKNVAPVPAPAAVKEAPAVQPFVYSNGENNFEDTPVSQMRKVIARRLGESKFSAPHFYLTVEIDMANAMESRKRINEIAPVKISFNDIIVKACAVALRQHPQVNSSWLGDTIRLNKNINIGVAVGIDEGLLVPVIRHADMKSLSQISAETKEMAGRARTRKLQPQEMSGNTFTISNLGMFNIEEFTAIINPPDACILAVGSIVQKPVVKDGEIVVGNIMKVTLSSDHRIVDGVVGAKFLQTLRGILEDPIRLLV